MRLLLYISVLPVILLLIYVYKKDIDKEPRKMLTKLFIYGALSTIVALFLEERLDLFFNTDYINNFKIIFIYTICGVGFPEEICKWCVTYFNTYNDREFDHRYDAIVYAVFVGLGFACIENIAYVVSSYLASGNYTVGIVRALFAVPSHACNAVIMGYFLGLAKDCDYKDKKIKMNILKLLSIFIPTLSHSLYDSLIEYYTSIKSLNMFYLFLIYVVITYIVCFRIVRKISKIKTNLDGIYIEK